MPAPAPKQTGQVVANRWRKAELGGWMSIIGNSILFVGKAILAIASGSLALIADAIHTLSDMTSSIILLISIRISRKPGDWKHPFGHGRVEHVGTIIIATFLVVAGFEIARSGIKRIWHPQPVKVTAWILFFVFLTVVFKELLARVAFRLAKGQDLKLLEADAWHHRTDAISSILVLLSIFLAQYQFYTLDGWASLFIALFILYMAYRISRSSIDDLLGSRADYEFISRVEEIALSVPGVQGVHDVVIHSYGAQKVISLHIEVDEKLSLNKAHQLSEQVDNLLRQHLQVYSTVHVDPVMQRTPDYQKIEQLLQEFCQRMPQCEGFHDLRMVKENNLTALRFDLVLSADSNHADEDEIVERCKEMIREHIPEVDYITVKLEPGFSISRRSRHSRFNG